MMINMSKTPIEEPAPIKIESSKTVQPNPEVAQGLYQWSIENTDGTVMTKYNDSGSKNVYADKSNVIVPIAKAKLISLTNAEGKEVASLDVPAGAVVFQRRRQISINFNNKFYDVQETVPATRVGNVMLPAKTVTKTIPEQYYDQVWLIGWRRREADKSVSLQFQAVYPDGLIEEYTAFGVKSWLYEPQWFTQEQV
jgi:hypothetical protein